MIRKIITSPGHRQLQKELGNLIWQKKRTQAILLITPHFFLSEHLMKNLANETIPLAGIYTYSLPKLAEQIQMTGDALPVRLIPDFCNEFILESMIDPTQSLGEITGAKNLAKALCRTIGDLKQAGIGPRQFASLIHSIDMTQAKYTELSMIFLRYQERLANSHLVDIEDLIAVATQIVPNCSWLKRFSSVILYGFYQLSLVERKFLEAVWATKEAWVFLPYHCTQLYRPVESTIQWLESIGFGRHHVLSPIEDVPSNLEKLQKVLFTHSSNSGDDIHNKDGDTSVQILSCGDEHKEGEIVAQSFFDMAQIGIKFEQMCVMIANPSFYLCSLRDTLISRDIPVSCQIRWNELPQARLFMSMSEFLYTDFSREALEKLTGSSCLNVENIFPAELQSGFRPSEWNWLGSHLHISHGIFQWRRGLDFFASQGIEDVLRSSLSTPSTSTRDRKRWKNIVASLQYFLGFWENAARLLYGEKTWEKFMAKLLGLFEQVCTKTPTRERVVEILSTMDILDCLEIPPSMEMCYHIADLALANASDCEEQNRVVLTGFSSTVGIPFDTTIIVGMAEKEFPVPCRQDPLLPDRERIAINAHLKQLSHPEELTLAKESTYRDKLLFHLAISGTNRQLILTFPRQDALSSKEHFPSPLVLDVAQTVVGHKIDSADFEHCGLVTHISQNFYFSDRFCQVWPLLYDVQMAQKNAYGREHCLADDYPFFAHARQNLKARWQNPSLTCYEGVLRSPDALEILEQHRRRLHEHPISASMLETYVLCPFRYFLRYILDLPSWYPRGFSIPSLRSTHQRKLLAQILTSLWQTDLVKESSKPFSQLISEVYDNSALQIFYPDIIWKAEREKMIENLDPLCLRSALARGQDHFPKILVANTNITHHFHDSYRTCLAVEDDFPELCFYGNFEQVCIDEVSKKVEGVQYRIGKPLPGEKFCGGEILEPYLDLVALYEKFPDFQPDHVRYRYIQEDGKIKEVCFSTDDWDKKKQTLREICSKILYGIKNGFFLPTPAVTKCVSCPYVEPCGPLRYSTYAYKSDDPRISFFHEIKKS